VETQPVPPPSSCSTQQLRRKAEERNPDEFYFGMETARTAGGVHIQRSTEANKYSQEELRLMRTQDVGYLTLKAQAEAKVRARRAARCCLLSKVLGGGAGRGASLPRPHVVGPVCAGIRLPCCCTALVTSGLRERRCVRTRAESGAHAAVAAPHRRAPDQPARCVC
jgi:hypothetical protein